MKRNKIFGTLALVSILALLLVVIPASPALAAESIELDPEEGEINEYIDIDGEDFDPTSWVTEPPIYSQVDIYFSSDEADDGDYIDDEVTIYELVKSAVVVDEWGSFSTRFRVPDELTDGDDDEDVRGGQYYVYATYDNEERIRAVAEFTVVAGEIEIDPDEGTVGTEVEISGQNFGDSEEITIYYDDDYVDIASGDEETDRDGEFSSTIIIPDSFAGDHIILVTDEGGSEVEAEFTVEPEMTISPTSGIIGDRITVRGTGFAEDEDVTITFDAYTAERGRTDENGSFVVMFNIPEAGPGAHTVEAEDESDNADSAEFTITISAAATPTTGDVGTKINVSGAGFLINQRVTITYDGKEVATATTDSKGAFSANFNAPVSEHGDHQIVASDGTNRETFTFTMESTPPPIPAPLLPQMDVEAEALTYFDWEDVTDPSGVTYTLQIATDEDFSTGSIVLEKEELTKSEYTITESQKLESTKKEAPYYWRVKAIDGASNESGWTGAGSFYIGFQFTGLQGWPTYVLMGIGGVVLILIGFWLGRRTSYYA